MSPPELPMLDVWMPLVQEKDRSYRMALLTLYVGLNPDGDRTREFAIEAGYTDAEIDEAVRTDAAMELAG